MDTLPTLQASDLACRRGNRRLFAGVSLQLSAGQALWLRGRNGRGKTSLLRLAAGLALPAAGRLTWGGVPVHRAAAMARSRVYVAHTSALSDDLSVIESLRFLARLHGRDDSTGALHAALDRLGMGAQRGALGRTLSQGQRRRATLTRLALERTASIWLLDEPYDALDADAIEAVNTLLRENLARGGSVLLTSHQGAGPSAPPLPAFDLDAYA